MSLMKTLTKVAIGVAVAKAGSSMLKGNRSSGSSGTDGLFRGQHSPGGDAMAGNPLEGMMDSILGGGAQSRGGAGGLGGMLEQLAGGQSSGGASQGGLGDLLGGLAQSGGAGGLGGLLGGLASAAGAGQSSGQSSGNSGSFGQVFNSQFDTTPEPAIQPTADQEAAAALMLSAMLQAAKSDGKFDASEQAKLMEKLGDVSAEEKAFVNNELSKPVDVEGLARQVPNGLQPQVYMMSVLGIDLDSQEEAQYLHQLATAMGINKDQVNTIHDRLGVTKIYG